MTLTRRTLARGSLATLAAGLLCRSLAPGRARAQAGSLFPFPGDDGRQVMNYRLPAEPSIEGMPGVLWTGTQRPEVELLEYFDYNCPFCRKAAEDLDALLRTTPGLRLGLVNNPVLSPGSVQAAKVQQAVLRGAGPVKAYAFHRALYAKRGPVDGPLALAVAGEMGLDRHMIEKAANLPQIGDVVVRQGHLAAALGFEATPSFQLGNIGLLGYPGPDALGRAVANMRRCDKLSC